MTPRDSRAWGILKCISLSSARSPLGHTSCETFSFLSFFWRTLDEVLKAPSTPYHCASFQKHDLISCRSSVTFPLHFYMSISSKGVFFFKFWMRRITNLSPTSPFTGSSSLRRPFLAHTTPTGDTLASSLRSLLPPFQAFSTFYAKAEVWKPRCRHGSRAVVSLCWGLSSTL